MPQFDPAGFAPQLVWLAITFVALYLILARIALPRIADVLEHRADHIADDLDRAEGMNKQAESALAAYEAGLAEARARAHDIAAEKREAVKAEAAAHQARLGVELKARIAEAEAGIAAASDKAMASVGDVAAEAALAVVARLIGVAPDGAAVTLAVKTELVTQKLKS